MVNFEEVDGGNKTVNLVNSEDENLKKMGLKPLYFHQVPLLINLNGNIFYGGSRHYACNLSNDVICALKVINSKHYDRYEKVDNMFSLQDNYTLHFKIYDNKIYFDNPQSYTAYNKFPHIREELTKKFNLSPTFYKPTRDELFKFHTGLESYFEDAVMKETGSEVDYSKVKAVTYNLTPKEELELKLSTLYYQPFRNPNQLDLLDVRFAININSNLFMEGKCSMDTTGIYNENALHIINNLYETKFEIEKSLYEFAYKAKDMRKLVHDLLVEFNLYHEYVKPELAVSPFEGDFSYELIGDAGERMHWDDMFREATDSILVQVIGFDKIETSKRKTITTTKPNIYEEFYNFILMDYDIVRIPKLVFDEDTQLLRWVKPNELTTTSIDRECEEEINKIKKYVPYKDRHLFLKK